MLIQYFFFAAYFYNNHFLSTTEVNHILAQNSGSYQLFSDKWLEWRLGAQVFIHKRWPWVLVTWQYAASYIGKSWAGFLHHVYEQTVWVASSYCPSLPINTEYPVVSVHLARVGSVRSVKVTSCTHGSVTFGRPWSGVSCDLKRTNAAVCGGCTEVQNFIKHGTSCGFCIGTWGYIWRSAFNFYLLWIWRQVLMTSNSTTGALKGIW